MSRINVDKITGATGTASGAPITLSGDTATLGSGVAMAANHSGVKTALNASGTTPIYACRAWVNFDGTGTPAIRSSGNVSSITDTATGRYQINFTTAFPNDDYAVVCMTGGDSGVGSQNCGASIEDVNVSLPTTSMAPIVLRRRNDGVNVDSKFIGIACFL